jgi:hypothetical protein
MWYALHTRWARNPPIRERATHQKSSRVFVAGERFASEKDPSA